MKPKIMNNITFILPIHTYDKTVEKHLSNALKSLNDVVGADECILEIVGPENVLNKAVKLYDKLKGKMQVKTIVNDDTNLFTQINVGVEHCDTEYFTIFEYDDKFAPYWPSYVFNEVMTYYDWKSDIVMPIIETMDEDENVLGFANELAWSKSFSEELGIVSMDSLEGFSDFIVSGSIIKTSNFKEYGGLKPSLGLTSWYEFLLRAKHNGCKIFVTPKVGYYHMFRETSYFNEELKILTPEKGKWLIETARHEYFFRNDRNKTFEENENE